jgi:hypothetical protein
MTYADQSFVIAAFIVFICLTVSHVVGVLKFADRRAPGVNEDVKLFGHMLGVVLYVNLAIWAYSAITFNPF